MILQNYLANYSFLTLLGSMIFYWIETSFNGIKTAPPILVSASESFGREDVKSSKNKQEYNNNTSFAKYGVIISNILLGLLLLLRWKESGHFPLSNLYESLMFLSWCFTVLHLYIDYYTLLPVSFPRGTKEEGTNSFDFLSQKDELNQMDGKGNEFARKLFGAITTPSALLTNAFATFTLPKEMQEASPLVPALQSNWLMMHVTVMILSYAALILGSLLSIAFLIVTIDSSPRSNGAPPPLLSLRSPSLREGKEGSVHSNPRLDSHYLASQPKGKEGSEREGKEKLKLISLTLDNLSYRILGIGFPLLTIGILSGAVWANEAWGSYWSWDPKETWALLTWLIFAIYLHTRISKGWEGKKPAIIASFGLIIVWICYLGVNLIGEGLHSYGWITVT